MMRTILLAAVASCALFLTSCGQVWSLSSEGVSTIKDGIIIRVDKDGNVSLTQAGAYSRQGNVKVTASKK